MARLIRERCLAKAAWWCALLCSGTNAVKHLRTSHNSSAAAADVRCATFRYVVRLARR